MKQQFKAYIKYSSAGFQMIATILLCAWLGDWIDAKMGNGKPYATIALILFGVFASMFYFVRSISSLQNKEEQEENIRNE